MMDGVLMSCWAGDGIINCNARLDVDDASYPIK